MRRFLIALAVLVAVGLLLLARTFSPAALPLSPLPPIKAEPVARGPEGMTLHAISTALMASRGALAYRGAPRDEDRPFVIGGILVRHPRGDLLFDAGLGKN